MLHYLPSDREPGNARLGVVVAKKLLKRAVDRNKVKRVIREQFRCCRPALPSVDLIVRLAAKPAILDKKQLADEFLELVRKLPKSVRKSPS